MKYEEMNVHERVDEYLRRNEVHASAVGMQANARVALLRVCKWKRPPRWLVKLLSGIQERGARVSSGVAEWRNQFQPK